jgi:5-formaminoimidazole-4-carboxamide-1-beta-D-ribofuranosyl 5'-monophosphate synthetase
VFVYSSCREKKCGMLIMHFLSRVNSEVDSDHMLRLAYDVQLQLLAVRQKVLFGNQSAVGRKSRLLACWLAEVDEQLSTYNLCIDSD